MTTPNKEPTRGRAKPAARAERPVRIPMSGSRKRMSIDEEFQDPNFHYAWINDQKDLLFRAKRAGFEHVTVEEIPSWGSPDVDAADPTDSYVSMPVGHGTQAFYMKQPMEYFLEDREIMDAVIDARESDMKKDLNNGQDGKYGGVEFTDKAPRY